MAGLCEGGNEPPGSLKANPETDAHSAGKYVFLIRKEKLEERCKRKRTRRKMKKRERTMKRTRRNFCFLGYGRIFQLSRVIMQGSDFDDLNVKNDTLPKYDGVANLALISIHALCPICALNNAVSLVFRRLDLRGSHPKSFTISSPCPLPILTYFAALRWTFSIESICVSQTMVRGPPVVLEVCPCGPSKKTEEKIKFNRIAYHTIAENLRGKEKKYRMVGDQVSTEGVAKQRPVALQVPLGQGWSDVQGRCRVATAILYAKAQDAYDELNCVNGQESLCRGSCLQLHLVG
ncbi:hypothetical protein ANN_20044 [Periplaneta americana]|uniref:Uncharacterized protein n=1 Tax=Periplaneta americana TaxID=6978 RepID=A0ABQ8SC72_PERAM|nr:hypothetical protein ANN_20044 [Periplaneta americana]